MKVAVIVTDGDLNVVAEGPDLVLGLHGMFEHLGFRV